jgi:beta-glucuronidase
MINVPGRKIKSLDGQWKIIIDPYDTGDRMGIGRDAKPKGKTDFIEYSFDAAPLIKVPGDFNSQLPELTYYEGTVWYKRNFNYQGSGKRVFLHFGAVNYTADVYLNGEKIGSHEGGFTPFQFEITGKVKAQNSIVVRVNNQRHKDGIPAMDYDWFNYGGINRDVSIIETPKTFIEDYFIQLAKGSDHVIRGWVKMNGPTASQKIRITIEGTPVNYSGVTGDDGVVAVDFTANLQLWSPEHPKLYQVHIFSETDSVSEKIGFRTIETNGPEIRLNGKKIFLKGINIHEEISSQKRKSVDEKDALQLLTAAKELGCNFVRTAHYPHNEYMVRLADKMGIMLWEEIPLWQNIAFDNPALQPKMNTMLHEMISRDKNRCSIIIWSVSNETVPGPARTSSLVKLANEARKYDATRLIASAINRIKYDSTHVIIDDSLCAALDVVGVNAYLGWYKPWVAPPGAYSWTSHFNIPMIMSEFGGEALYGHHGSADTASSWSEEYQEKLYNDNIIMFRRIPFLAGTTPWVLYDFRSVKRLHSVYQRGWNRKGLLSDKGKKKKAWYVMRKYYAEIK